MADDAAAHAPTGIGDSVELRRMRWRARRGLLENDLLLGRFLDRYGTTLDETQNRALLKLLQLPDTELLDLLLARTELAPPLDCPEVRALLEKLRAA